MKIKYIMFIIHNYAVFYLALFGFWYFTHTWKALEWQHHFTKRVGVKTTWISVYFSVTVLKLLALEFYETEILSAYFDMETYS